MLNIITDLIFPPICLNCRGHVASDLTICTRCMGTINLHQTPFCGKCGLRLGGGKRVCHKDFPYLLGSATDYSCEAVKSLIHGLKFQSISSAAKPLAALLTHYAEMIALPLRGYTVIPIPLSPARFRERGFNQSELIARLFAERFELLLDAKNLVRTKNTKPQSETKNIAERRENVKECFAVRNPELLQSSNVILIDDVTTTGVTLFEAANALKAVGVRRILALTVAKA